MNPAPPPSLWQNSQFRIYLGSTAFTGMANAMQQLLMSWLLVGILVLPANQVGMIQAVVGLPGILLMLWGGASADRSDPRGLLIRVYAIAWLFPLALFADARFQELDIFSVALYGVFMSTAIAFSSPAQQAILNRTVGKDVQRGVTAATAMGFIVQMLGLAIAGQMENVGVGNVLLVQSTSLILGVIAITRITPLSINIEPRRESTWTLMMEGLRAAWKNNITINTLFITFTSGIFNAGAFMTALPFVVKRVYDGDALGLATIMIVFYSGATISNFIQYWVMPLARPGFWFLVMQATRVFIILGVWLEPDWYLLMAVLFLWGLNMGVTTNLSRALVQEASEQAFLGRVLSVYNLGLMGSAPIGALVIGYIIEAFGTMNAMVPAMFVSTILCIYGFTFTDIGRYRSPAATSQ